MGSDIPADALDRYEAAKHRAVFVRAQWEDEGTPTVYEQPNGMQGVHPLFKAVLEAEKHADRLMKSLSHRQARAGRPAGAQSAPDRGAARLKVVGQ